MKYFLTILFCFAFARLHAQQPQVQTGKKAPYGNFYQIRDKFYDQYSKHELKRFVREKPGDRENPKDDLLEKFKRWEWLMEQRTYPTGNLPAPSITATEMNKYKQAHPEMNTLRGSNWEPIGAAEVPAHGGGAGRINALRFDPSNNEIMYAATAGGGLWKFQGNTWQALTDQLPVLSTADVAIDPTNSDILYVATGDGYGYEATWQSDNDFWGGVYSAGVFKSTDGGITWSPTGLSYMQDSNEIVQRLVINPVHPNILLAATRNGIFYTDDAGTTWSLADATHCYDFAFNPEHPDTVYSGGNKNVLWSTDGGATWSVLASNVIGTGRISIETSAANSSVLYIFNESGTFKRSDDGGLTWVTKQTPNAGFYGYYDTDFDVSQVDENYLIAGGISTSGSTDGGAHWSLISDNDPYTAADYVHADGHCVRFYPGSTQTVFSANDGGLFESFDFGTTWSDLSNGLMIAQLYRMSSGETNPDVMYSGWQDNGSNKWDGSGWTQVYGADGMEARVDYTDENIAYIESQYGNLMKTTDGGNSFQSVSAPGGGSWLTPYTIDPVDHNILYYGGSSNVYQSTNGGSNWTSLNSQLGGECFWVEVSPADHNYVYACSLNKIKRSSDQGNNWTDITGTLPVGSIGMNYIAAGNQDPLNVFVAFSGYQAGEKVFHSTDGGATWTNISGTLPNIPVNCIIYENNSPNGVYIGTDVGVFYHDDSLADWVPYMNGLPNVMVHELEINYTEGKLRAATYGRGMWQSDLYYAVQYTNDLGVTQVISPTGDVCTDSISPVVKVKNYGLLQVDSFQVSYSMDGGTPVVSTWNLSVAPNSYTTLTLPAALIPSSGIHQLAVSTSNPNGVADNNLQNDADTASFNAVAVGMGLPFAEGFESGTLPPPAWTLENDHSIWYASNSAGGFGNSVFSALADFRHVSSGTDVLTTPYLSLLGSVPPITFTFDWAHANYNPTKLDSLRIQISSDCGNSWTDLFYKGGDSLASVPNQTQTYVPANTDWKTESIDLSPYNNFTKLLIRFMAISDHGNQLYLDDINIAGTPLAEPDAPILMQASVFPNPSSGLIYIHLPSGLQVSRVALCNLLSVELTSENVINESQLNLDASTFPAGMYFVKIVSEKGNELLPVMLE